MQNQRSNVGYFGKSIHGPDFIEYNLPQSFVTVWKEWVDALLLSGAADNSGKWPQTFKSSPRYLFALSSGVAGPQSWMGVIAPGTDAFGRLYPICLAAAIPDAAKPLNAVSIHESWLKGASELLAELQDEDFQFTSLNERVDALADRLIFNHDGSEECSVSSGLSLGDGSVSFVASLTDRQHPDLMRHMVDGILSELYYQYSVWISLGYPDTGNTLSETDGNSKTELTKGGDLVLASGFPSGAQSGALFDNKWTESGYSVLSLYGEPGTSRYNVPVL